MNTEKPPLRYFIGGMDCAHCAHKVEAHLGALPGTRAVRVTFSTETLELDLDETKTPKSTVEEHIKALGYTFRLTSPPKPPSLLSKNPLLLLSGAVLMASWTLGYMMDPLQSEWGYRVALLFGLFPSLKKVWLAAKRKDFFGIHTLVFMAALGALVIGETAEGAVVVFLFALGEQLERWAGDRARSGIRSLMQLTPQTATLLENGVRKTVPVDQLRVGQVVEIAAGERVSVDGTILEGFSAVDNSSLTGESIPVQKNPGDAVFAGSISVDGRIRVRVDKGSKDNRLAQMIHLVEEAEHSKAHIARLMDRISHVYTPFVVAISVLVALVYPLIFQTTWHDGLYQGLALLLIGCPCALVISVPAAMTSGIARGAKQGLLIKGGAALEQLAQVTTLAFDKTGTLTVGRPQVTDVIALNGRTDDILALAASMEQGVQHPVGRGIWDAAQAQGLPIRSFQHIQTLSGRAIVAKTESQTFALGSPRYARETATLDVETQGHIHQLETDGKTVTVLLENGVPMALIALRDELKPDAELALGKLKRLGLHLTMLTGDNAKTAQSIANILEIEVQAELLPEDKMRWISDTKQFGKVAMVGDGINDAPALTTATVGIAMGQGTDVALECADATLLKGTLGEVLDLVVLARDVQKNVRQNISVALGLKGIFLVATLFGYTELWMAILADTGATVLVTINALRLLRVRSVQST
ncbi:MAG: heavy metal translocating P-type ATPase [Deinococcaceae bacterium]